MKGLSVASRNYYCRRRPLRKTEERAPAEPPGCVFKATSSSVPWAPGRGSRRTEVHFREDGDAHAWRDTCFHGEDRALKDGTTSSLVRI